MIRLVVLSSENQQQQFFIFYSYVKNANLIRICLPRRGIFMLTIDFNCYFSSFGREKSLELHECDVYVNEFSLFPPCDILFCHRHRVCLQIIWLYFLVIFASFHRGRNSHDSEICWRRTRGKRRRAKNMFICKQLTLIEINPHTFVDGYEFDSGIEILSGILDLVS